MTKKKPELEIENPEATVGPYLNTEQVVRKYLSDKTVEELIEINMVHMKDTLRIKGKLDALEKEKFDAEAWKRTCEERRQRVEELERALKEQKALLFEVIALLKPSSIEVECKGCNNDDY